MSTSLVLMHVKSYTQQEAKKFEGLSISEMHEKDRQLYGISIDLVLKKIERYVELLPYCKAIVGLDGEIVLIFRCIHYQYMPLVFYGCMINYSNSKTKKYANITKCSGDRLWVLSDENYSYDIPRCKGDALIYHVI